MKSRLKLLAAMALLGDVGPMTIERETHKAKNGNASWMRSKTPKQKKARAKTKRQSRARSIMRKAA